MPRPSTRRPQGAAWQSRASKLVRRRPGLNRRANGRPSGRYQPEPVRLPEPDERQAYRILNFSLLSAEALLSGGAGASDVAATAMAAANACGLEWVEVDVTFTSISISYVRSPEVAPVTSVRVARRRSPDYTRVTEVHNLVTDLVAGRLTPDEAFARLETIRHRPHPYPRWAATASLSGMAAAIIVFLGGGPAAALTAAGVTALIDRLSRWMSVRNVPHFFQNVAGAALATVTAAGMTALHVPVSGALVVAGGIILLLPGVTLVGSVQDSITGYFITGTARAMETAVLTAGIIAGVGTALGAAVHVGVSVPVAAPVTAKLAYLPLQVAAAGAASALFALSTYSPRRLVPSAAAAGALGWAAFLLLRHVGAAPSISTVVASTLVGAASFVLAGRQKAPPLVLVAAGAIPLLPGHTIYRGMFALAQGTPGVGLVTLVQALVLGLALASGAILGEFLAQPTRRHKVPRFERRLAGPRLAGPLTWREEDTVPEEGSGAQAAGLGGGPDSVEDRPHTS